MSIDEGKNVGILSSTLRLKDLNQFYISWIDHQQSRIEQLEYSSAVSHAKMRDLTKTLPLAIP